MSLVVGPAEFAQARGEGWQARPARPRADGSTGASTRPSPGLDTGGRPTEQCARAWEAVYRHYGHIWELTARSPKGDPTAAREMATASWAVAAAWRQIEATTLPWWAVAAIQSAAAAFEEQARKYETDEDDQKP